MVEDIVNSIYRELQDVKDMITVSESSDSFEHIIEVIPYNSKACRFEFRISHDGKTVDVFWGCNSAFERLEVQIQIIQDIVRAIICGLVKEDLWCLNNKIIKSNGKLILSNTSLYSNRGNLWLFCLTLFGVLAQKKCIEYESYVMHKS